MEPARLRADVRVIAATHRDLAAAIARQAFREDLYYRLNVFQIHIAPLRERTEDIPAACRHLPRGSGGTIGRPAARISRDEHEWLLAYHWPGNVRELRNAIERAILLCDGGLITRDHLPSAALEWADLHRRTDARHGRHGLSFQRLHPLLSVGYLLDGNGR